MVVTMSLVQQFILLLIYVHYCFSLPQIQSSNTRLNGFSSKLINRNSLKSPFYTHNLTRSDRITLSVKQSFARHNYLQRLASKSFSVNMIDTPVWFEGTEYVMEYFIGRPAIRTYAILDTGSALTWLQCLPCERCYNQPKASIYDPTKSSSYKRLTCSDTRCQSIDKSHCESGNNICQYRMLYADASSTLGDVIEETLDFTYVNRNFTMHQVVIGCGHNNNINIGGAGIPGLIGLIRGRGSLLEQLHYEQFTLCFGDADNKEIYGYASFGEAASITGYKTPIQFVGDTMYPFYYLNLEGISVDNTSLSIPNGTFNFTEEYNSGFIIDSGAQYTFLKRAAFDLLVDELDKKLVNLSKVQDPNNNFKLCYQFDWMSLKFAPIVTLHLTSADLQLPNMNTWINVNETIYCLAMYPTDGTSILGHFQQQNYKVGYDLEHEVVSFDLGYCGDD